MSAAIQQAVPLISPEENLLKVTQNQRHAADPQTSVWVGASAGTGKTKILIDRLLNLLLDGTDPEKILCLTFTKAAAAEMSKRLTDTLSLWSIATEYELSQDLQQLKGRAARPEECAQAKTLLGHFLDASQSIKIQTIHSFCQSILKRFPLEAGIHPHFTTIDEQEADNLIDQTKAALFAKAAHNQTLSKLLKYLLKVKGEQGLESLLNTALQNRERLTLKLEDVQKAQQLFLDIGPGDTTEKLMQDFAQPPEEPMLKEAALVLSKGSTTEQKRGDGILQWLGYFPEERAENALIYSAYFLTKEGGLRASLATKKFRDKHPDLFEVLKQEAERIQHINTQYAAISIANCSAAFCALSAQYLSIYQDFKQRNTYLDYDDLIQQTQKLLKKPGISGWILYKLDAQIDHILVDEAQDTNPSQWQIIEALTEEFFAGQSARDTQRTLFVVGDSKQSIYSFQKADPRIFEAMRGRFSQQSNAAQSPWQEISLSTSFRSTPPVLQAVDTVFNHPGNQQGVLLNANSTLSPNRIAHIPHRQLDGGIVEVWPLAKPDEELDAGAWELPTTQQSFEAPANKLTRMIALTIKHWFSKGEMLTSHNRAIEPKDIMILIRKRGSFMEKMIKMLKLHDIPVAGVDRIQLNEQLAVQDLIALGKFLMLPTDDLSLACVLKGPFIALSEEQLFTLSHGRKQSLWSALQSSVNQHPDFQQAYDILRPLFAQAADLKPFDFFSHVLNQRDGKRALIARLGHEIEDAIEEFLNLCLQFERKHIPTLQGFISWFSGLNTNLKRDTQSPNKNEVRVMTVHGSKGLEAPIVFLPDTTDIPKPKSEVLWHSSNLPFVLSKQRPLPAPLQDLKDLETKAVFEEYNRLLYVAMTRAEERLYICGWCNKDLPADESWYQKIFSALKGTANDHFFDPSDPPLQHLASVNWLGDGLRMQKVPQNTPKLHQSTPKNTLKNPENLPKWIHTPVAKEHSVEVLRPSEMTTKTASSTPYSAPPTVPTPFAKERGILIHRCLEILPRLPENQHLTAFETLSTSYNDLFDSAAFDDIYDEVQQTLETHSDLFKAPSITEAALEGFLDYKALRGRIDRLVDLGDNLLILDYKTDAVPPKKNAPLPESYRVQLQLYQDVLTKLYPGHKISAAILWTKDASLTYIR